MLGGAEVPQRQRACRRRGNFFFCSPCAVLRASNHPFSTGCVSQIERLSLMTATRRDVLTAAVTAAGATATSDLVHAQDHSHQAVPSDVALRVKSLESLLVEKG